MMDGSSLRSTVQSLQPLCGPSKTVSRSLDAKGCNVVIQDLTMESSERVSAPASPLSRGEAPATALVTWRAALSFAFALTALVCILQASIERAKAAAVGRGRRSSFRPVHYETLGVHIEGGKTPQVPPPFIPEEKSLEGLNGMLAEVSMSWPLALPPKSAISAYQRPFALQVMRVPTPSPSAAPTMVRLCYALRVVESML
jgi:hypothetical protein